MAYKEENGLQILQPEQDEKRDKWLDESLKNKRHGKEVKDIYKSIVKNAKRIQARHLFDYNIVLIGFMGAGKSTISDYLSTCFAMEVVEMDQIFLRYIEKNTSEMPRLTCLLKCKLSTMWLFPAAVELL